MADRAYVVTSGEYSDYRIRRVYLDRAAAEEYARRVESAEEWASARVEEYPIGAETYTDDTVWCIAWDESCSPEVRPETVPRIDAWDYPDPGRASVVQEATRGDGLRYFRVCGTDLDAVVKSARDRISHIRAQREGVA